MTRKRILQSVVALTLLTFASSFQVQAQYIGVKEWQTHWYYDDTFATLIGEDFEYCDASTYSWGSHGSWRIIDSYWCATGVQASHTCQQTDGQGGWIDLACPF